MGRKVQLQVDRWKKLLMIILMYFNTTFLHFYLNSEPLIMHIVKSKFISMMIWGWRSWKIKKLQINLSTFMKENTISTFSIKWWSLEFMWEIKFPSSNISRKGGHKTSKVSAVRLGPQREFPAARGKPLRKQRNKRLNSEGSVKRH